MQRRDDVSDRLAHPGNFAQAIFRHDLVKRFRQRNQVFGCAQISAGAIAISAAQGDPLAELDQQARDFRCAQMCRQNLQTINVLRLDWFDSGTWPPGLAGTPSRNMRCQNIQKDPRLELICRAN
jgi:hypothetical protein